MLFRIPNTPFLQRADFAVVPQNCPGKYTSWRSRVSIKRGSPASVQILEPLSRGWVLFFHLWPCWKEAKSNTPQCPGPWQISGLCWCMEEASHGKQNEEVSFILRLSKDEPHFHALHSVTHSTRRPLRPNSVSLSPKLGCREGSCPPPATLGRVSDALCTLFMTSAVNTNEGCKDVIKWSRIPHHKSKV